MFTQAQLETLKKAVQVAVNEELDQWERVKLRLLLAKMNRLTPVDVEHPREEETAATVSCRRSLSRRIGEGGASGCYGPARCPT